MSTWIWDLLGALTALFILVVTVVDILVAVAVVTVLRRWWHEHDHRSDQPDAPLPPRADGHPVAPGEPAQAPDPAARQLVHSR